MAISQHTFCSQQLFLLIATNERRITRRGLPLGNGTKQTSLPPLNHKSQVNERMQTHTAAVGSKAQYDPTMPGVVVVLSTGKLQHCTIKLMLEEGLGQITLKCRQLRNTNDMAIFVV